MGIESREQTVEELFEEYKNTHDEQARNKIVSEYSYIARAAASRYTGRGVDYDDLYQIACIGLILAVERFDADKGIKFVTFALPTISGEIKRYFRDKGNFIRIPRRIYEVFSTAEKIRRASSKNEGGMPNPSYKIISLEQDIIGEGDLSLESVLGADDDRFLLVEDKDFVQKCMASFTEQERQFIKKRYYEEKTQKQIALEMQCSQMNVSRMERRLLKELKVMYFED